MNKEDFVSERSGRVVRAPRGYWAYIPRPLPPALEYSPETIRILADASQALGELAGAGRMLPNPHLLVSSAIRREAVLSSRIEGTQTEIEDLFLFEAETGEPPRKADVKEVHNYVVALEYGLQRVDSLPISLRLVRELHSRLLSGVRGQHATPGEFRTTQNWIGPPGSNIAEATFVPPPEDRLMECLSEWELYIHREEMAHPLVRLALIHYQFEAIHPFADGNGRVGRLLIALLLVHWGLLPQPLLYLSAFFERHRDDYMRGLLRVSQAGEWEAWTEFFLRAIREQSAEALQTVHTLTDLQSEYRKRLHDRRNTKITHALMESLFAMPVVTVPQLRARYKVSFHTAQRAVEDLEAVGVLHEITELRRDRVWAAREVMRVLSGKKANGERSNAPHKVDLAEAIPMVTSSSDQL